MPNSKTAKQPTVSDRQQREIDYHRDFAAKNAHLVDEPVEMDVVTNPRRRWWNAYWHIYTLLGQQNLAGKNVLVPGGGFGKDAIRIASLGAKVCAFDISEEIASMARERADKLGVKAVTFDVMPAETLTYPDNSFDAVFFLDILHHVDIPQAMAEVRRVLKPGGLVIGDELYAHSFIQRVRESWFIDKVLYPRMVRFIYSGKDPYITKDEHKIDQTEFAIIEGHCTHLKTWYFNIFTGRLFPDRFPWLSRIDRSLVRILGPLGNRLTSRVVFQGTIRK